MLKKHPKKVFILLSVIKPHFSSMAVQKYFFFTFYSKFQ